ncbi:hypothetical protein Tco_0554411 [Tanacetum coccineum]
MEQDPDSPPNIWFQPPLATPRRGRKPPIDPVILIILIPILALVFLFFFLPPFLLHTSHILKPGSVKSTWDSLNIFLVIFAILCGVLARKNEGVNEYTNFVGDSSSGNITSVDSSGQVFGYSDTKVVSGGLRRNSSSYPDLRNGSVWENNRENNRNRFYDDFDVYNSSPMTRYYGRSRSRRNELDSVEFVKEIVVDTVAPETVTAAAPPPPPPPPPQPKSTKRHSFRSVGRDEFEKVRTEIPSPPPPPPLVVAETTVSTRRTRHKHKKLERKVSDATKEIATAISNISSMYNKQKKRKNKRKLKRESESTSDSSPPSVHSTHSVESMDEGEQRHLLIPPSPPPPPPPPPPPFKFQNFFKKGAKHKKIHSVPATITSPTIYPPLPPPLPPPPNSIFNNIFKGNKSKRFNSNSSSIMNNMFKTGTKSKRYSLTPPPPPPPPPPMTPPRYTTPIRSKKLSARESHAPPARRSTSHGKPPLPAKTSYYEKEDFLPSGSQSPLIPMPPPPPPPFRVTPMKFELRGEFVRVRSTHSSVCSSPDRDDVASIVSDGGDSIGPNLGYNGPISFPSPDVNAKADSFISRLKDEWMMERNNKYVNEKSG